MSQYSTLSKAKKILAAYDDIEPRKYCANPYFKKQHQPTINQSFSSLSKSTLKKDFSFSKSPLAHERSKLNATSLHKINQNKSSFVSLYGKQTRYDKIMKLKVKPGFHESRNANKTKKSILQHSLSSSNNSFRQTNKENRHINRPSRFQKIMSIKIAKPQIRSTLINYEPRQGSKSITKQKKQSVVKEWKQSQNKIKKSREVQQKQDRLWKVFERQREIRQKLKKNADERQFIQQRRKQKRFETLVSKQIAKIQKQRDVCQRKREGFANYIYPFH